MILMLSDELIVEATANPMEFLDLVGIAIEALGNSKQVIWKGEGIDPWCESFDDPSPPPQPEVAAEEPAQPEDMPVGNDAPRRDVGRAHRPDDIFYHRPGEWVEQLRNTIRDSAFHEMRQLRRIIWDQTENVMRN